MGQRDIHCVMWISVDDPSTSTGHGWESETGSVLKWMFHWTVALDGTVTVCATWMIHGHPLEGRLDGTVGQVASVVCWIS